VKKQEDAWTRVDTKITETAGALQRLKEQYQELGTVLGSGAGDIGARASVAAVQAVQNLRDQLAAQADARRALNEFKRALQASVGGEVNPFGNAQAEMAILNQIRAIENLEKSYRDLFAIQELQRQNQVQMAILQAEEARAVLDVLPARREIARLEQLAEDSVDKRVKLTERLNVLTAQQMALGPQNALEDTEAAIRRAQLVLQVRGTPPAEKAEARRTIRELERNVAPQQRLAAFDTGEAVRKAQQAQQATDIATDIVRTKIDMQIAAVEAGAKFGEAVVRTIQEKAQEVSLKGTILSGAAAVIGERVLQIQVNVQTGGAPITPIDAAQIADEVRQSTYTELLEANKQAILPPVVVQSGYRRN
jgi:hypothetical protein